MQDGSIHAWEAYNSEQDIPAISDNENKDIMVVHLEM